MKKALLYLIVFMTFSAANATNYYISASGGSDSNPGTQGSPFLTVQKGLNTVLAGDTCFISAGTYNESLIITTSGASGAPIAIKNYNGELVIINSGKSMSLKTSGKQSWYVIDGLRFISDMYGGDGVYTIDLSSMGLSNGWPWSNDKGIGNSNITFQNCYVQGNINLYGANNTVRNCEFNGRNKLYDAIHSYLAASTNTKVLNNTIHDYLGRAVWLMSNTDNALVTGNNIYNTWLGIDCDGAARPVKNCHIIGNIVTNSGRGASHDYGGHSIFLENAFGAVVDGNLVYNSSGAYDGIYIINYGNGGGSPVWYTDGKIEYRTQDLNAIISNNLIYGNGDASIRATSSSGVLLYNNTISGKIIMNSETGKTFYTQRWVVRNNIFTGTSGPAWDPQSAVSLSTTTFSNNLYWNVKAAPGETALSVDPKFVSTNNFRLQDSSPAIDAGYNLNNIVPNDFDSVPRPQNGNFDIGAFEYISPKPCAGKVPAQPNKIIGNLYVCPGTLNTYSIAPVLGATWYTWKLPDGWKGTSTTNSIYTKAGATGGNITVIANNECYSSSTAQIIIVNTNTIPEAPVITLNNGTLLSNATNDNQWYLNNRIINTATDVTYVPSVQGNYYVVVTVNGCPSEPSNLISFTPTGINGLAKNEEINVYPNPTSGLVKINLNHNFNSDYMVDIYDNIGILLQTLKKSKSETSFDIDLTRFSTGGYLISIYNSSRYFQTKVVKK